MPNRSLKMKKLVKGAKMGDAKRMYLLGICYELGDGVECDMEEAAYWISRSAALGYAPAEEWMRDYYSDDDPLTQAYS